ncbi:hypothetical protein HK101_002084 [Irineochytrium annulatum]|nr:hypothetical protein HK101_002084 [Irineochytrium annulatum]
MGKTTCRCGSCPTKAKSPERGRDKDWFAREAGRYQDSLTLALVKVKFIRDLPDENHFSILKHEYGPQGTAGDKSIGRIQTELHKILQLYRAQAKGNRPNADAKWCDMHGWGGHITKDCKGLQRRTDSNRDGKGKTKDRRHKVKTPKKGTVTQKMLTASLAEFKDELKEDLKSAAKAYLGKSTKKARKMIRDNSSDEESDGEIITEGA